MYIKDSFVIISDKNSYTCIAIMHYDEQSENKGVENMKLQTEYCNETQKYNKSVIFHKYNYTYTHTCKEITFKYNNNYRYPTCKDMNVCKLSRSDKLRVPGTFFAFRI